MGKGAHGGMVEVIGKLSQIGEKKKQREYPLLS